MKAIVNTAAGRLEWRELPLPKPRAGWVRIRTSYTGICATDLEMMGGWERTGFPSIPGHEWSGRVDELGPGVGEELRGKPCVAENVLSDGGEVGFEHPGGYAEYFLTEAKNVHVLPEDFDLSSAPLIEPLAVCVRGLMRMAPVGRVGAVILGDGPIGLLLLALLHLRGFSGITLVGGRLPRLRLAEALGASETIDYHACGDALAEQIRKRHPAPRLHVLEASGSPLGIQTALEVADRGAKLLCIGDYGALRADFPWNTLLHRELAFIGSNASSGAWAEAVKIAVDGGIPLGRLVTLTVAAPHFDEAIAHTRDSRDSIKATLDWTRA
ncbi:MAG: alcohol dehydrogenase catalytic domain-containing protein [Spirochaetes bacterium]|nr:alcohol dehydrogenase catalytic domain-containing protein [Spirochaetota bacterium]